MKWRIDKEEKDLEQWHPYFAWMPVTIGLYRYWLCWVNRKAENLYGDDPMGSINWKYEEMVWYS